MGLRTEQPRGSRSRLARHARASLGHCHFFGWDPSDHDYRAAPLKAWASWPLVPTVMGLEVILIVAASLVLAYDLANGIQIFVIYLSLALGLQNGAFFRVGGISVHTTYLTGMITSLISTEAEKYASGEAPPLMRAPALRETSVLHSYLHPVLRTLGFPQAGMHAFRHGCNRRWELSGMNPAVLRQQMGHTSAVMTARYTGEIPLDKVQEAFSKMELENMEVIGKRPRYTGSRLVVYNQQTRGMSGRRTMAV